MLVEVLVEVVAVMEAVAVVGVIVVDVVDKDLVGAGGVIDTPVGV